MTSAADALFEMTTELAVRLGADGLVVAVNPALRCRAQALGGVVASNAFLNALAEAGDAPAFDSTLTLPYGRLDVSWRVAAYDGGAVLLGRELQPALDIEAVINILPVAVFLCDPSGSCTFVNSRWTELTGRPAHSALGVGWVNAIHPDDRARVLAVLASSFSAVPLTIPYRILRPNGEVRHVIAYGAIHVDALGHLVGFIGTALDVTQSVHDADALRRSESTMRAIIESTPEYIMKVNRAGEILFTNRRAAGVPPPNPSRPRKLYEYYQANAADGMRLAIETAFAERRLVVHESEAFIQGKSAGWFRHRIVPLDQAQDEAVMASIDITAERSMAQAAKLASLGEMAAGVAHEINNPLAVIHGVCGRLRHQLEASGKVEAEVARSLDMIERTSMRIAQIVRGLLAFSRGEGEEGMTEVGVRGLIDETLGLCAERLRASDIELRVPEIPASETLRCRPVQVVQVLLNLVANAADAVESRLAQEERWIEIMATFAPDTVELVVTDSGPGIPPSVAERMLEPFFTTKPVGKGTGLGLSIARGIVHGHGGALRCDAAAPRTRFVVALPRYREPGIFSNPDPLQSTEHSQ